MKITRRDAVLTGIVAGVTAATSSANPISANAVVEDTAAGHAGDPGLEFAFEIIAKVEVPMVVGQVGDGERRVVAIKEGSVKGPKLNGKVLPGGTDYQMVRDNGVSELQALYTLETEDGAIIHVDGKGIREATREIAAKINAGEEVAPSDYYFRTTPRLETDSEKYDWVNRRLFVCKGVRKPDTVEIRYYLVT